MCLQAHKISATVRLSNPVYAHEKCETRFAFKRLTTGAFGAPEADSGRAAKV